MNKLEVLDYIKKHNKEYGGKLVTEKGFKKHFEELYNILQSITFPPYSEKWDFKQKLWHFCILLCCNFAYSVISSVCVAEMPVTSVVNAASLYQPPNV